MKKVRKADPRDGWYEITPSDAQTLLDKRVKNRPLSEFRAQGIAGEIAAKRWRENGESIICNDAGRVLDGQHRLRGCVLANKPIVAYMVFGVPDGCFATIDQGKNRSGSDLAALMGFQHSAAVAAVASLAMRYADGSLGSTGGSHRIASDALRAYMARNADRLTASAGFTTKHKEGLRKLIPLSHAAFVHYMVSPTENGKASEFVETLATGAGLSNGDARLLFRRRMQDLVGQKHALTQEQKLGLLIKAWNAYRAGEKVGVLRLRNDEAFPRFAGDE